MACSGSGGLTSASTPIAMDPSPSPLLSSPSPFKSPSPLPTSLVPTPLIRYGSIGLSAIPGAAMVSVSLKGSTAADLTAQMNQRMPSVGGHTEGAYTSWHPSLGSATIINGVCSTSRVTLNDAITVTGPIWTPPPGTDPSLVAEWRQFMVSLTIHEKGHVDIILAGAPYILQAVHATTCANANAAATAVVNQIGQQNVAYDAATNHGATQGAYWPPA